MVLIRGWGKSCYLFAKILSLIYIVLPHVIKWLEGNLQLSNLTWLNYSCKFSWIIITTSHWSCVYNGCKCIIWWEVHPCSTTHLWWWLLIYYIGQILITSVTCNWKGVAKTICKFPFFYQGMFIAQDKHLDNCVIGWNFILCWW